MPETLPHNLFKRTSSVRTTEKWIAQNPWRFFLIIVGCFLCSLILHLNLKDVLFSDQPGLLRHSLIGSWIVGTMCAYLYADQLPPAPVKPRDETRQRRPLFVLSARAQRMLGIFTLWTLLITSLSVCVYLRTGTLLWEALTAEKTQVIRHIPAETDKHDYLNPADRELFESEILNLLFISADDIDRTSLASHKPVDMSARRKYFSEEGWKDYQAYVRAQKHRLIEQQGNSTIPLKARAELVDGTRKYKALGSAKSFTAEGIFLDAADTIFTRSDTFKLHIDYAAAGASGEVLINSWKVVSENLK